MKFFSKKFLLLFSLVLFFFVSIENFSFSATPRKTKPKRMQRNTISRVSKIKKGVSKIKTGVSKIKRPIKKLKEATKPVGKAVAKTAETAVKEVQTVAEEAHSLGGKFLQAIINIMIAASPGKTRVYLPAVASDPNSGFTGGLLPVFLFVNKNEVIQHILAPSITHNNTFGVNGTMRYYWYPHPGAQLFTIGSYATETNRRFTLRYEDPKFLMDWAYFKIDYTISRDGSYRFFGLGPNSSFENQSNYNLKENHLQVYTGINLWEKCRFTLSHRFRFADVIDGPIKSLPKISDFSPRPEGVENPKTMFAQRFSFSFDSRDAPTAPISGYYLNLFAEVSGHLGGDTKYERLGTEFKGLHPSKDARFVTGWRFLIEGENGGENIPFYERSLLGGKDSLRGFGDARFVDDNKASMSLEERIRFYTLKAFNVNVDFEVTPFYETGIVYHRADGIRFPNLHHVAGIGFRTVVRPNVVGVIDLGFGEEGTALFVGIDYPF